MRILFRALRGRFARGAISLAVCSLLVAAVACEDDDGPTGPDGDEIASVTFENTSETLDIGTPLQLVFEIRDEDGNVVDPDDVTVTFSSDDQNVATVSNAGLVTPVAAGTATVTVTVGTVTDTVTITVNQDIGSVDVTQTDFDLVATETFTLDVEVLDSEGDPVTDPDITFTSSDQLVATVSGLGVITAVGAGETTITATAGDQSDTVIVTVLAAGAGGVTVPAGATFTAPLGGAVTITDLIEVRDDTDTVVVDPDLTFVSSDETVVTVDAAGLLTALAVGQTLVTVSSPDAADPTATATFRVTVVDEAGVGELTLDPATATVAVGAEVDIDAVIATTGGDPIGNLLVLFTTDDATVATVNPFTGEVTGVAAGTATITGTSGTLTATSEITVE